VSAPLIDTAAWSSPWRHRSPGDKIFLGLGLTICALLLPPWPGSLLVTVAATGVAVGPAAVRWRVLFAAARGPIVFIALGSLGIAVTWHSGGPGQLGPTVTGESLVQATRTAGRAIAGTAGVLVLAATTPISDLLGWARRRNFPEAVVDVAGLVYRLLFVLLDTTGRIRDAQTARLGYATRRAALRSAGALAAAVLTRAWSRASRLEEGLVGRGLDVPLRVLDDARPTSPRFVAASTTLLAVIAVMSLLVPHLSLWPGQGSAP
jgi:cobalt/nickel transport system permease protein